MECIIFSIAPVYHFKTCNGIKYITFDFILLNVSIYFSTERIVIALYGKSLSLFDKLED